MTKVSQAQPEEARYRRKSKTASTSNSKRRSDHKHQYEKIIVKWLFGYRWARRCVVCGRVDDSPNSYSFARFQDFIKPEAKNHPGISDQDYLSIEEIQAKFPGIDIYEIDEFVLHGGLRYKLKAKGEEK